MTNQKAEQQFQGSRGGVKNQRVPQEITAITYMYNSITKRISLPNHYHLHHY